MMIFVESVSLALFSWILHNLGSESLVETSPPPIHNIDAFLVEFESTFGDTNHHRMNLSKALFIIYINMCVVFVYIACKFRQLACDVQWDGQALCDFLWHSKWNQESFVKELGPTSLSQANLQENFYDKKLFELHQEEWEMQGSQSLQRYATSMSTQPTL